MISYVSIEGRLDAQRLQLMGMLVHYKTDKLKEILVSYDPDNIQSSQPRTSCYKNGVSTTHAIQYNSRH